MTTDRRISSIEWCKLLSILAVVYQHGVGASSTLLTHFAVPAFTFISVYFATMAGEHNTAPWSWLKSRSMKLYLLYFKWNILYAILRWLSFAAAGTWNENYNKIGPMEIFLTGCANAMYYLPFIIAANAFCFSAAYLTQRSTFAANVSLAIIWGGLACFLCFSTGFAAPKIEWISFDTHMVRKSMPAVALVLSWYFLMKSKIAPSLSRFWLLVFATIFLSSGIWHLVLYHRSSFYGETAAGLGFVLLFLALAGLPWPVISSNLSLWIFISHSFLLHGIRFASKMVEKDYDLAGPFVQITASFLMMAILIGLYYLLLGRSSKLRKWILIG